MFNMLGKLLILYFLSTTSQILAQEPLSGEIKDLLFLDGTVNPRCRVYPWASSYNGIDESARKNGTSSYKIVFDRWGGFHTLWHGLTNEVSWAGPDTSVFWAQSNSRLQAWLMTTTTDSTALGFQISDNYGSNLGTVQTPSIPQANSWFFVDIPIPSNLRNIPLKMVTMTVGELAKTLWIDDMKVTNVRLYAGTPQLTAQMSHLGLSQLGFLPRSKKQFSSPLEFSSFAVRRVSDNAVVLTGGGPVRNVPDAQGVVNGAPFWIGDFSALETPGRYKIDIGTMQSYPFDIRSDIFDQSLRAAQRFYYYQRAFTAVEQQYAEGPWYRPTDVDKAPSGVVKGWHDAGDLTIYNASMAQSIFWFLEAWSDFRPTDDNTNIPESGNGIPDLLDEARWGLEWVISMQDANGGFWGCATANNGTNSYHYGSTFPHTVGNYVKTVQPTVQSTSKAVAVLAYASYVYRSIDQSFSNRCLTAARAGWNWMIANPNATNDGCFGCSGTNYNNYAQGSDATLLKTNRMWAAAGMLVATGESQYENAFQQWYEPVGWISSYSKSDGFASSLYLRAPSGASQTKKNEIRQRIFQMADGVRDDANRHPFQFATHYYWGTTSNGLHRSGQFSWKAYLLDTTRLADRDQALFNIEYIFGRNILNQVYLSGINGVSKPRSRGFHHWMKALNTTPWHFPGALSSGPNQSPDPNDISYPNNTPYPTWGYYGDPQNPRQGSVPVDGRFTDNDSWSTNEVAINWNAVLVYNLHAARMIARGGSIAGAPSGTFTSDRDSLPPGGGNITLSWTSANASSASIDQGIGTVPVNGSVTVTVGQTKIFTLTLTNSVGSMQTSRRIVVGTAGGGGNPQDITAAGTPTALVTAPTGNGNRNIEVIRDGILPPAGSTNVQDQYDTYNGGGARTQDWIGFVYPSTQSFGSIRFQEGVHASNGGWFSSAPKVQLRIGGNWVDVQGLSFTPSYSGSSAQNFTTYDLRFNATSGDGIRIIGTPGGSARFISVGELRVFSSGASSVDDNELPKDFALEQNYPNPFNPTTNFRFAVPSPSSVQIVIYNLLGQNVRTLANETFNAGIHELSWDGRDNQERLMSSGTYFCRMSAASLSGQAGNFVETKKMLLTK